VRGIWSGGIGSLLVALAATAQAQPRKAELLGDVTVRTIADPMTDHASVIIVANGAAMALEWRCGSDGLQVLAFVPDQYVKERTHVTMQWRFAPSPLVESEWSLAPVQASGVGPQPRAAVMPKERVSGFMLDAPLARAIVFRVVAPDGESLTDTVKIEGLGMALTRLSCQ
jgi:hypothetical protein